MANIISVDKVLVASMVEAFLNYVDALEYVDAEYNAAMQQGVFPNSSYSIALENLRVVREHFSRLFESVRACSDRLQQERAIVSEYLLGDVTDASDSEDPISDIVSEYLLEEPLDQNTAALEETVERDTAPQEEEEAAEDNKIAPEETVERSTDAPQGEDGRLN